MKIDANDRGGMQVISRAAAILRSLEGEPRGLSLGAIAKRIDAPRSTVQRLVDALAREELLELHSAGGVRIGPALVRIAAHRHTDIIQMARPYLEELSRVTGETAVLTHASQAEMLILHTVISTQDLRVAPQPGNYLPIHRTAGGKVLLSMMGDDEVRSLLAPGAEEHAIDLDALIAQLAQIRAEGFAYDRQEQRRGVGAVATGLHTAQGNYAIIAVGPSWRIEDAHENLKAALATCQTQMETALNGVPLSAES